jgi:hypothetical protein
MQEKDGLAVGFFWLRIHVREAERLAFDFQREEPHGKRIRDAFHRDAECVVGNVGGTGARGCQGEKRRGKKRSAEQKRGEARHARLVRARPGKFLRRNAWRCLLEVDGRC